MGYFTLSNYNYRPVPTFGISVTTPDMFMTTTVPPMFGRFGFHHRPGFFAPPIPFGGVSASLNMPVGNGNLNISVGAPSIYMGSPFITTYARPAYAAAPINFGYPRVYSGGFGGYGGFLGGMGALDAALSNVLNSNYNTNNFTTNYNLPNMTRNYNQINFGALTTPNYQQPQSIEQLLKQLGIPANNTSFGQTQPTGITNPLAGIINQLGGAQTQQTGAPAQPTGSSTQQTNVPTQTTAQNRVIVNNAVAPKPPKDMAKIQAEAQAWLEKYKGGDMGDYDDKKNGYPRQPLAPEGTLSLIPTEYRSYPTFVNSTSIPNMCANSEALKHFIEMSEAAFREKGLGLKIRSGFRDYEGQLDQYNKDQREMAEREKATGKKQTPTAAPPGYSEHHTGYAFDIANESEVIVRNKEDYDSNGNPIDPQYSWLKKNMAKYGFEYSYPVGNKQGVMAESWHIRFNPKLCEKYKKEREELIKKYTPDASEIIKVDSSFEIKPTAKPKYLPPETITLPPGTTAPIITPPGYNVSSAFKNSDVPSTGDALAPLTAEEKKALEEKARQIINNPAKDKDALNQQYKALNEIYRKFDDSGANVDADLIDKILKRIRKEEHY